MRRLGILLMAAGSLACAFATVRHADAEGLEWQTVEWTHYAAGFVVAALGVILIRASSHGAASQTHKVDKEIEIIGAGIAELDARLDDFLQNKASINVYDVHVRIDQELVQDLGGVADARESMIHKFGLQEYANVMTEFAGAERLINRAWSASADGYQDEVWLSLERAAAKMSKANRLFGQYRKQRP